MSARYIKLQPIQYNDDSLVKNVNIPYKTFIEKEGGYELEVSCKILNSRTRIGGPLHLKLKVTNIGGVDIEKFKIDINSFSSEDNQSPYYDRYVLWINEKLEVGYSIIEDIVLKNSYRNLDISNNDLSVIITDSEKDLRKLEYNIQGPDDPLDFSTKTNLQSKTRILSAISNEQSEFTPKEVLHDRSKNNYSSDQSSIQLDTGDMNEDNYPMKSKEISFNDNESLINNKNIPDRTKRSISIDQQYNTIISPIYDNFYCKDDTLVINKKKKMKSLFLTEDYDYLISTLPSVIHIEFRRDNMKLIPCRQYQFKLCSEYFTGDLLVARPCINIPKDKTPRYTHYNILMLGSCKNGKTSLINSFLTLFNNRITYMNPYLQKLYHDNKNYILYNIKELLPESLHVRFYDCPLESIKTFTNSQYSYKNLDLVLSGNFPYDFPINTTNVDLLGKIVDEKPHPRRLSISNQNGSTHSLSKLNFEKGGGNGSNSSLRPYSINGPLVVSKTQETSSKSNTITNTIFKIHVVILALSYTVIENSEEFKLYTKLFRYITQLNIPVVVALTNIDKLNQDKVEEYLYEINNAFKSSYVYPISNYTISNNKLKSFEKDRNILRLISNSMYLAQQSIYNEFNEENIIKAQTINDVNNTTTTNLENMTKDTTNDKTNKLITIDGQEYKYKIDDFVPSHNVNAIIGCDNVNVVDMTKFTKEQISTLYEDVDYDTTIFENITRFDVTGEEDIDVILAFDGSRIIDREILDIVKCIGLSISSQYPQNINIGGFLFGEKIKNISGLTSDISLFESRLATLELTDNRLSADGDTLYRALNHCKTLLDSQYRLSKRQQLWIFISECSNDNYYQIQAKKLADTLRSNQYNCEIFCFYIRQNSEAEMPIMVDKFLKSFIDLVVVFNDMESIYGYLTPPATSYNNILNPKLYLQFLKILRESSKIHLLRNQLTGYIPYNIGNLTKITSLNLNVNLLTSYLPNTIGNLVGLTELQLSFNKLTGLIPVSIGNLNRLTILKMSNNQFFGPIPYSIGNLVNLTKLRLENNKLSGAIPESIGNLVNLEKLQLNNNCINGLIPRSIGNLTKLRILQLGNNKLSGNIPSAIGDLSNLAFLYLNDNYLVGTLPDSMSKLKKLSELHLQNNESLSGDIPSELTTSLTLKKINIHGTKLKKNTSV
ncbi:hypothetical protein BCR32DRAFT_293160 [Anaeromyces robustus]|uniref:Disease resistance R13L4/SHOC-2-like LRR domain-containing protein n=1 Tax=Anaeromyces robustus TaxID=1754192 RepID=A0A1Y1X7B6_9FUNG|nr:hypothetical protein BCR32DRAFT_293160 [Anaeromyces robustus]|eukprot:ORX81647.1 hypothetical protein BCR32DRAFT_293160 [Anaeromyces robustus]